MVKITLSVKKSLEENAAVYFDKAKKAKKKIEGAKEAVEKIKKKLESFKRKEVEYLKKIALEEEKKNLLDKRVKKWYHKFRWFFTSDGFLVIGGRDATTNELVIKKHTEKDDVVFHTDMSGSPFFVLKTEGKQYTKETLREVADATCTFSKAWQLGLSTQKVFHVNPDQVTKEAQSGEYLSKGAFMIRGKTSYLENQTNLAIGMTKDHEMFAGPKSAVEKHCKESLALIQGDEKVSSIAKKIQKLLGGDLDEIIRVLPAGGFKLEKGKK